MGETFGIGLRVVLVAAVTLRPADDDLARPRRLPSNAPSGAMMAISGPAAGPTLPGLRAPGGSGFDAIWWAASVMP